MHHVRLLEKLAAWRRTNGFDWSEVLTERQHRTQGHVYSQIDVYFDPRRPPISQQFTEVMWAQVNRLRQEHLLSQLPSQYDLSPRQSPARPPEQPSSVSRMTTDTGKMEPEKNNQERGEIPLVHVLVEGKIMPEWIVLELSLAGTGPGS